MSDELRAAAEMAVSRCPLKCSHKSGAHIWNAHQICQWCHATRERYNAALVARDYLSDHPADDGEAVTVEWLESVGFSEEETTDIVSYVIEMMPGVSDWPGQEARIIRVQGTEWILEMRNRSTTWTDGVSAVGCVSTRGDVRRLCDALGITLAEKGEG